jgi:hypothetical protein
MGRRLRRIAVVVLASVVTGDSPTILSADVETLLAGQSWLPLLARSDVAGYVSSRLPPPQQVPTSTTDASRVRARILDEVILRGEATSWAQRSIDTKWGPLDVHEGYSVQELSFDAVPGLRIPAQLYRPHPLSRRPTPVMLALTGHEPEGMATEYARARCVSLARRGVITLNVEFLGYGKLGRPGLSHERMHLLDLVGTPGLSVFYLAARRALDVLLSVEGADPYRVGVSGHSGGGWQTLLLSALDTRVTLAAPVAGYADLRTRLEVLSNLGDSEQLAPDFGTVADYTHLTALLAPRATLLTFNNGDDCCFAAEVTLPPLLEAARPAFARKPAALRVHVDRTSLSHNYGRGNREALYALLGEEWFADEHYDPTEADVEASAPTDVVRPSDSWAPTSTTTFASLADALVRARPTRTSRAELREVLRYPTYTATSSSPASARRAGLTAHYHRVVIRAADAAVWTLPVIELTRGRPTKTVIMIADGGMLSLGPAAADALREGRRVLLVDPLYFGVSKPDRKAFRYALMLGVVGERLLGIQAAQLEALGRWAQASGWTQLSLEALGPRASLAALAAAAASDDVIGELRLAQSLSSLHQLIEGQIAYDDWPAALTPRLFTVTDIPALRQLVEPRPQLDHRRLDTINELQVHFPSMLPGD